MASDTYTPTGSGQTHTVPPGVNELYVDLYGGQGAGSGGLGGQVSGVLDGLTPGEDLYIYPGQSGANGGHPGGGSGRTGGGYSAIRQGTDSHANSQAVAAGGGGEGEGGTVGAGGDGGADTGQDGGDSTSSDGVSDTAAGGDGATQSAGGAGGGTGGSNADYTDPGSAGSAGQGGAGGDTTGSDPDGAVGGGGGGGWKGGGGGGAASTDGNNQRAGGAGAGGSNYDDPLATVDTNARGVNSGDGQVVITYIDLTLTVVSGDRIDLAWGDIDLGETNYEILRAESSGSTAADYTTIDTVGADVTSYQDTGLEDGERYYYRVRAIDGSGEVLLGQEQNATTSLPAPTIDSIDNSVEDELTLNATKNDDSTDGESEIFRSTDGTLGTKVADGLAPGTTSYQDTGLDDGTTYHYTWRRLTDHAQADSTQLSATTFPPAPSSLSVDSYTIKQATLSWVDNSDSESVFRLLVSTDGGSSFSQHGSDLSPGTTSTTATDLPTGPLVFKVRAVMPDTTADSGPVSQTIPGYNPKASGWEAVVISSSGHVYRPSVIESGDLQPQRSPKANDRPSIRIPVPKNEKWDAINDASADIDLFAWQDGVRQPIDTLDDVEQRPDATILVGTGGRELTQRVTAQRDQQAVHKFVEDLLGNTTYTANVDTPPNATETNQPLDSWSDDGEFESRYDPKPLSTDPIGTSGGAVNLLQSCYHADPRNNSGGGAGTTSSSEGGSSDYVDGAATLLDAVGEYVEITFTTAYDIPEDRVGFAVREGADDAPGLEYSIDGQVVDSLTAGAGTISFGWTTAHADGTFNGTGWIGGTLEAGTHTVRIECTDRNSGEAFAVDWVVLYDTKFSYTFDNTTDANNQLAGPEKYPDEQRVSFREISAPKAVTGARAELTVNEGATPSNNFAIRLSNNQGASFAEATNVDTFETDDPGNPGADFGPSVILEVDLSRYGSQTATPTQGISGHSVSAVTLEADFSNIPIVRNHTEDGHLDDILRNLAEIADALWAVEWDATNDTMSVEWTAPGQRTATDEPEITDYNRNKSTASVYQKAAVYGRSDIPVTGEQFTADTGTAVQLSNDRIQPRTERVVDPSTGELFRRSVDYTLDDQVGEITALSGGNLSDGSTYEISYNFQAFGEYDDGTSSPAEAPPAEVPGLVSDFLCQQAARIIVDEVSQPLYTAEVVLPNDETGWSVVESLDPPIVPTGGNALHVRAVRNTPEGTVLTLGSRRTFSDVVADIRAQVGSLGRKA